MALGTPIFRPVQIRSRHDVVSVICAHGITHRYRFASKGRARWSAETWRIAITKNGTRLRK